MADAFAVTRAMISRLIFDADFENSHFAANQLPTHQSYRVAGLLARLLKSAGLR